MTSLDYEDDGMFFGAVEVASIEMALNDIKKTQEKVPTMSDEDKLGILIDFDKDGILET